MKKLISFMLTIVCIASLAIPVLAEEATTTLTTTVPSATYTMTIPEDTEVTFGKWETSIGTVNVTATSGFAEGKNVKVSLIAVPFTCEETSTTIPFTMNVNLLESETKSVYSALSGVTSGSILFKGCNDGKLKGFFNSSPYTLGYKIYIYISNTDWGKALAGDYTGGIVFSSEIVSAE